MEKEQIKSTMCFVMKMMKGSWVTCCALFLLVFSACSKDENEKEHNWQVSLPSTIVANGDYLTTSVYGNSDYDFNVNYYWDGALIQTTDKSTGLNYLVNNQSLGDHKLKVECSGEAKGACENIIQVYDKNFGFLGCEFIPNNRKVKNGESIQGSVIYVPSVGKGGLFGEAISAVRLYIDEKNFSGNDKSKALQTITSAPFKFCVPISGLAKGEHQLVIETDGVWLPGLSGGSIGGVAGTETIPWGAKYNFTVTE